jgi:hypothetical protein
MGKSANSDPGATRARPESIGRVVRISGSQATVDLVPRPQPDDCPTVGKFIGLKTGKAVVIGLITEISEEPFAAAQAGPTFRTLARLDLIGEFNTNDASGALRFQRGFSEYPNIGDVALMLSENMLGLIYGTADADRAYIGDLQQNLNTRVYIDIDRLVSRPLGR